MLAVLKTLISLLYMSNAMYSFILEDPNYSLDYINPSYEQKPNLRQTFLDKRNQQKLTSRRLQAMDKYLNDSVFVDGVMHELLNERYIYLSKAKEIENAFRNLINLNGVKFIFKRDHHWRTWRRVKYPDGEKMVCYKCQRSSSCKDCQYGGYWVIDEKPPCPFEILSTINSAEVCAINMKNTTNIDNSCPSVVLFNDILSSCDNPIDTQWRLQSDYKARVSERNLAVLCGGRDFCDISTYYLITPNHVTFRITNSNNHVMYSKVMKPNNNTYVCIENCGNIDPISKTLSKTDKPLTFNLIIGKREGKDFDSIEDATLKRNVTLNPITDMKKAFNTHREINKSNHKHNKVTTNNRNKNSAKTIEENHNIYKKNGPFDNLPKEYNRKDKLLKNGQKVSAKDYYYHNLRDKDEKYHNNLLNKDPIDIDGENVNLSNLDDNHRIIFNKDDNNQIIYDKDEDNHVIFHKDANIHKNIFSQEDNHDKNNPNVLNEGDYNNDRFSKYNDNNHNIFNKDDVNKYEIDNDRFNKDNEGKEVDDHNDRLSKDDNNHNIFSNNYNKNNRFSSDDVNLNLLNKNVNNNKRFNKDKDNNHNVLNKYDKDSYIHEVFDHSILKKDDRAIRHAHPFHHHHHQQDKKHPTCSSLKHLLEQNLSEDIETYYNVS